MSADEQKDLVAPGFESGTIPTVSKLTALHDPGTKTSYESESRSQFSGVQRQVTIGATEEISIATSESHFMLRSVTNTPVPQIAVAEKNGWALRRTTVEEHVNLQPKAPPKGLQSVANLLANAVMTQGSSSSNTANTPPEDVVFSAIRTCHPTPSPPPPYPPISPPYLPPGLPPSPPSSHAPVQRIPIRSAPQHLLQCLYREQSKHHSIAPPPYDATQSLGSAMHCGGH